jgi:hypothetical protein
MDKYIGMVHYRALMCSQWATSCTTGTKIVKAYASLNPGGLFIAIENVIDDARRKNTFGLLMSLNMLIELPGGFDYTGATEHQFQSEMTGEPVDYATLLRSKYAPTPATDDFLRF